jgi:hypothetical protein
MSVVVQTVTQQVEQVRRRSLMKKGARLTRRQALARLKIKENADRDAERLHAKVETFRRQGLTTSREIAAALNEAGFRTPRGRDWSADTLRTALTKYRNQGRGPDAS